MLVTHLHVSNIPLGNLFINISLFNVIIQILNSKYKKLHWLFSSFCEGLGRTGQITSSYTKVKVIWALSDKKETIQEWEVNRRKDITTARSQLGDMEIISLMGESVQARGLELTIAITMAERGKRPTLCSEDVPENRRHAGDQGLVSRSVSFHQ